MLKLLIVAFLSVGNAFKVNSPAAPTSKALKLRGGADVGEIAKYAVYFTSAFMFLPLVPQCLERLLPHIASFTSWLCRPTSRYSLTGTPSTRVQCRPRRSFAGRGDHAR